MKVLGTDPAQIDKAEDRHKFSSVLDGIGVDQPEWAEVTTLAAAKAFAEKVGCVHGAIDGPTADCMNLLDTQFLSDPHMFSLVLQ